jgi:SulP family sulfate permease
MKHTRQPLSLQLPIATALRDSLRQGYTKSDFLKDLSAGFIVSLVALPLAMALSIAIGLPPQHGLYTAVVAGVAAALFGGSRLQVSGPTAAFVVIIAPIVAEQGLRGLIWCEIMAGIILLGLGFSRMGRLINYIPYPVTTGFTAGIAVVIATIALSYFLGLGLPGGAGHWFDKVMDIASHLAGTNFTALATGLLALTVMLFLPKLTTLIPSPIAGIGFATLAAYLLHQSGIEIDTIGSKFSYLDAAGASHPGVPPYPPVFALPGLSDNPLFALPSLAELQFWFMPAVVIAGLAALESLLSATVGDGMSGTRHDPNAELSGVGISNILSGLASGIPATGAIARTATNINAGGRSPFAAMFHGLFILAYMAALSPLIAFVPMSALSALLILTAWRMSHARQFLRLARFGARDDMIVLLACFVMTILIDMVAGVIVGVVLASLLFMKRSIHNSDVQTDHDGAITLPEHTMLFRFEGPLFFGTAQKAIERASFAAKTRKSVILDLSAVTLIDATGFQALHHLVHSLERDGHEAVIIRPKAKAAWHMHVFPVKEVRYAEDLERALKAAS